MGTETRQHGVGHALFSFGCSRNAYDLGSLALAGTLLTPTYLQGGFFSLSGSCDGLVDCTTRGWTKVALSAV